MICPGLSSQPRRVGAAAIIVGMSTVPPRSPKASAVCMTRSTSLWCPAPKWRATRTPVPVPRPVNMPMRQVTMRPLAPTAAAASVPSAWPTNMRSTVL